MPYAAPRPCPAPGCPALTNGGRCEVHRRAKHAAIDARRGSPTQRGYDRAWQQLRQMKLAADPWCEIKTHCASLSMTEQLATEVDHIQTIHDHPELRLEWSNLRSACKRCHSARTMCDLKERQRQPAGAVLKSRLISRLPPEPVNIHAREIGLGGGPHEH
jgi:5-methylcytosine-specific restriction endonuclease McrA